MKATNNFKEVLEISKKQPVLVQFFAEWCGPCKTLKPVLTELEGKANGDWSLIGVDIEEHMELANRFQIRSVPTVHLFHNGESIASFSGSKPAHIIQNWIDNALEDLPKEDKVEADALQFLKNGKVDDISGFLLKYLGDSHPENPVVKLLLALQNLGKNNPEARQQVNQVERKSKWGRIAKMVRDLIDMDDDEKDVKTPDHSPFNPIPKDSNERIDIQNIDIKFLNLLIHDLINDVRQKKGVAPLGADPILFSAARDQNNYMIRQDVLSHHQQDPNKRTVKERVDSFGGRFRRLGENVQYQGMQVRQWNGRREVIADSYINTAKQLVKNWVNSPGHYRNLISPDFSKVGTECGWNPENFSIFATQVFGA